jgi:hypothetical protein
MLTWQISEIGKCLTVEQAGDGVSHVSHRQTNGADFIVLAVVASLKEVGGGAGNWRQWTIKDPNHLPDVNLLWDPREVVAPAFSPLAVNETRLLEIAQDSFEEFSRNLVRLGDRVDQSNAARLDARQVDESLEPVFPFFCQHESKCASIKTKQLKSIDFMNSIEEKRISAAPKRRMPKRRAFYPDGSIQ